MQFAVRGGAADRVHAFPVQVFLEVRRPESHCSRHVPKGAAVCEHCDGQRRLLSRQGEQARQTTVMRGCRKPA